MADSQDLPTNRLTLTSWLEAAEYPAASQELVLSWLDRGDSVLGYQCLALDSSGAGSFVLISGGSARAQVPLAAGEQPPETLPVSYPASWSYRLRFHIRPEVS